MKTKVKRVSKRSLATLLAFLMLFSTLMVGTISTANAWNTNSLSFGGYLKFDKSGYSSSWNTISMEGNGTDYYYMWAIVEKNKTVEFGFTDQWSQFIKGGSKTTTSATNSTTGITRNYWYGMSTTGSNASFTTPNSTYAKYIVVIQCWTSSWNARVDMIPYTESSVKVHYQDQYGSYHKYLYAWQSYHGGSSYNASNALTNYTNSVGDRALTKAYDSVPADTRAAEGVTGYTVDWNTHDLSYYDYPSNYGEFYLIMKDGSGKSQDLTINRADVSGKSEIWVYNASNDNSTVVVTDRVALRTLINNGDVVAAYNGGTNSGYTSDSYSTFKSAYEDAASKFSAYATTQAQIDAALTALQNAYAALDASHTVTIGTVANGSITTDKSSASSGDTVTLTLSPNTYYAASAPTVTKASGGTVNVSGSDKTYTFTMPDEDVTVTGSFSKDSYKIIVNNTNKDYGYISYKKVGATSYTSTSGSATKTLTLEAGAEYEFKANPSSPYYFTYWTVNSSYLKLSSGYNAGSTSSNGDTVIRATVIANDGNTARLVAHWSNEYAFTKNSPSNGTYKVSTLTGTDNLNKGNAGTTYRIVPTPSTNYVVGTVNVYKTGDSSTAVTVTPSGDEYQFTMPGYAVTIEVTYVSATVEYSGLSATTSVSGAASSKLTASVTGATSGVTNAAGTAVKAANGDSGKYTFTGWTSANGTFDDVSSLTTTFHPTADNAVAVANFEEKSFSVTVSAATGGKVSTTSITAHPYTTYALSGITVTPDTGYYFSGWTAGSGVTLSGNSSSDSTKGTLVATSAGTLKANFTKTNYTITKNAATNGSFVVGTSSTATTDSLTRNYNDNAYVVPTANAGYEVDTVTVKDASNNTVTATKSGNSYKFTMPASNVTVTVTFKKSTYTATNTTSDSGINTVTFTTATGSGKFQIGDSVTITATAKTGYKVSKIEYSSDGGSTYTTYSSAFTVTAAMCTNGIKYRAVSAAVSHNINSTPGNSTITNLPASGTTGQTISFNVAANQGYQIKSVTASINGSGITVTAGSGTSYSFTVPADSNSANSISVTVSTTVIAPTFSVTTLDGRYTNYDSANSSGALIFYLDSTRSDTYFTVNTDLSNYPTGTVVKLIKYTDANVIPVNYTKVAGDTTKSFQISIADYAPMNATQSYYMTVTLPTGDVSSTYATVSASDQVKRILTPFNWQHCTITLDANDNATVTATYADWQGQTQNLAEGQTVTDARNGAAVTITATANTGYELNGDSTSKYKYSQAAGGSKSYVSTNPTVADGKHYGVTVKDSSGKNSLYILTPSDVTKIGFYVWNADMSIIEGGTGTGGAQTIKTGNSADVGSKLGTVTVGTTSYNLFKVAYTGSPNFIVYKTSWSDDNKLTSDMTEVSGIMFIDCTHGKAAAYYNTGGDGNHYEANIYKGSDLVSLAWKTGSSALPSTAEVGDTLDLSTYVTPSSKIGTFSSGTLSAINLVTKYYVDGEEVANGSWAPEQGGTYNVSAKTFAYSGATDIYLVAETPTFKSVTVTAAADSPVISTLKINGSTINDNGTVNVFANGALDISLTASPATAMSYVFNNGTSTALTLSGTTGTGSFNAPATVSSVDGTDSYTLVVTASNQPEGKQARNTYYTVTVNVSYAQNQKDYLNLKTAIADYESMGEQTTAADYKSGETYYNPFKTAYTNAKSLANGDMPAANSSDTTYSTALSTLASAYTTAKADRKTSTLYLMINNHDSFTFDYVGIKVNETSNDFDIDTTKYENVAAKAAAAGESGKSGDPYNSSYLFKRVGELNANNNSKAYLYEITYYGHLTSFFIYAPTTATAQATSSTTGTANNAMTGDMSITDYVDTYLYDRQGINRNKDAAELVAKTLPDDTTFNPDSPSNLTAYMEDYSAEKGTGEKIGYSALRDLVKFDESSRYGKSATVAGITSGSGNLVFNIYNPDGSPYAKNATELSIGKDFKSGIYTVEAVIKTGTKADGTSPWFTVTSRRGNLTITAAKENTARSVTYYVDMHDNDLPTGLTLHFNEISSGGSETAQTTDVTGFTQVGDSTVYSATQDLKYNYSNDDTAAIPTAVLGANVTATAYGKTFDVRTLSSAQMNSMVQSGEIWLESLGEVSTYTPSTVTTTQSGPSSTSTKRIYFCKKDETQGNISNWYSVYAYVWGGSATDNYDSWNYQMSYLGRGTNEDVYYRDIPSDATGVIFRGKDASNNDKSRTEDITIGTDNLWYSWKDNYGNDGAYKLSNVAVTEPAIYTQYDTITLGIGQSVSIAPQSSSGTLTYSTASGTSYASRNGATVTGKAVGTATYKVTATGTQGDKVESKVITVNVVDNIVTGGFAVMSFKHNTSNISAQNAGTFSVDTTLVGSKSNGTASASFSNGGIITSTGSEGSAYTVTYAAANSSLGYGGLAISAVVTSTPKSSSYYFDGWTKPDADPQTYNKANVTLNLTDGDYVLKFAEKPSTTYTINYKYKEFDISKAGTNVYDDAVKDKGADGVLSAEQTVTKTVTIIDADFANEINSVIINNAPTIKSNYFNYRLQLGSYTKGTTTINVTMNNVVRNYKLTLKTDGKSKVLGRTYHYRTPVTITPADIAAVAGYETEEYAAKDFVWTIDDKQVATGNKYTVYMTQDTVVVGEENDENVSNSGTSVVTYSGHEVKLEKLFQSFYIEDFFDKGTLGETAEFLGGGALFYSVDQETGAPAKDYGDYVSDKGVGNTKKIAARLGELITSYDSNIAAKSDSADSKLTYCFSSKSADTNASTFAHSSSLQAYHYIYTVQMKNNVANNNKNMRLYSYFIYKDTEGKIQVVVSDTYAEAPMYVAD